MENTNEKLAGIFSSRILERGWNYYKDGAVQSLTTTPTGYRATVSGTEDYEVEIELKGDEIAEMYCGCPYADGRQLLQAYGGSALTRWRKM